MPSFHYYAASWYTAKAHTHTHLSVLSHPLPPPPFGVGRRIMSAIFSIITLVAKILFRACAAAAAAEVGEEEGKKRVFRTIADQFPGERDEEGGGLFAGAQSSYICPPGNGEGGGGIASPPRKFGVGNHYLLHLQVGTYALKVQLPIFSTFSTASGWLMIAFFCFTTPMPWAAPRKVPFCCRGHLSYILLCGGRGRPIYKASNSKIDPGQVSR